jgi:cytochrome P450 monooxygenase
MHFGYGRNACLGRFFASMVIKAFAANILVNFDLKVAKERPKSKALGSRNSPSRDTEILLWVKLQQ